MQWTWGPTGSGLPTLSRFRSTWQRCCCWRFPPFLVLAAPACRASASPSVPAAAAPPANAPARRKSRWFALGDRLAIPGWAGHPVFVARTQTDAPCRAPSALKPRQGAINSRPSIQNHSSVHTSTHRLGHAAGALAPPHHLVLFFYNGRDLLSARDRPIAVLEGIVALVLKVDGPPFKCLTGLMWRNKCQHLLLPCFHQLFTQMRDDVRFRSRGKSVSPIESSRQQTALPQCPENRLQSGEVEQRREAGAKPSRALHAYA